MYTLGSGLKVQQAGEPNRSMEDIPFSAYAEKLVHRRRSGSFPKSPEWRHVRSEVQPNLVESQIRKPFDSLRGGKNAVGPSDRWEEYWKLGPEERFLRLPESKSFVRIRRFLTDPSGGSPIKKKDSFRRKDQLLANEIGELPELGNVPNYDIFVLGTPGSGKTTLIKRLFNDNIDNDDSLDLSTSTGKVTSIEASIDGRLAVLNFTEINPQKDASTTWKNVNADAFLVLYAADSKTSFRKAATLLSELSQLRHVKNVPVLVVGNKVDLARARTVHLPEAEQMAKRSGATHVEISSALNYGIDEMLGSLLTKVKHKPQQLSTSSNTHTAPKYQVSAEAEEEFYQSIRRFSARNEIQRKGISQSFREKLSSSPKSRVRKTTETCADPFIAALDYQLRDRFGSCPEDMGNEGLLKPNLQNSDLNNSSEILNSWAPARPPADFPNSTDFVPLRKFSIDPKGKVLNLGDSYKSLNSAKTDNATTKSADKEEPFCQDKTWDILVVGCKGCGKTALINQFTTSNELTTFSETTDEAQKNTVMVSLHGVTVKLRFSEVDPEKDRGWKKRAANAYLFLYAINSEASFLAVRKIAEQMARRLDAAPAILAGNKTDLARARVISETEGEKLAVDCGCEHFDISVAIQHRIDELLVALLAKITVASAPIGGTFSDLKYDPKDDSAQGRGCVTLSKEPGVGYGRLEEEGKKESESSACRLM